MEVEVFKTNVQVARHARILAEEMEKRCPSYEVNFDLDDCDRIMRVVSRGGAVEVSVVVAMMKSLGFTAEVLADDIPEVLEFEN